MQDNEIVTCQYYLSQLGILRLAFCQPVEQGQYYIDQWNKANIMPGNRTRPII